MGTLTVVKPTVRTSTLSDLIDDYLEDCKRGANGHRKLSSKTVTVSYKFPLENVFLPWAEREEITTPTQLTQNTIDRFAEEQKNRITRTGQPLSEKSVSTYVSTVQLWVNWLARKGHIPGVNNGKKTVATVQATIETPKVKPIDILDRDEIRTLERAARDERDKLIIRVLADTGMRVGELCSLTTESLYEPRLKAKGDAGHYLRVIEGKSGWRDVPVFDRDVWQRLKNYRAHHRPENAKSDTLFLTRRRYVEGGEFDGITESGVGQMVKTVGMDCGLPRAHPHLLRHSAATWFLQRGMPAFDVAKILGHSSLNMINRVYAHLGPADLYASMVRYLSE